MNRTLTALIAAAILLPLTACAGGEPSRVQTVTETATAAAPVPTTSEHPILAAAWDQQTAEDQYTMCFGWGYDRETMIDTFFAEAGGSLNITRSDVIEFFDGKCG